MAGVALGDIQRHFAWQAWHLREWAGSGRAPGSQPWAGVALGDIHLHFVWQALVLGDIDRHFCVAGVALTALGGIWWRTGFSADAVGAAALCVAGVALGDIDFRFAWQAWHLVTSTFTLRGRRGTWSHPHSFHVAGVALTAMVGLWWCTGFSAHAVDAAALCVAGVGLGDIDFHFAWQAWHLRHWA